MTGSGIKNVRNVSEVSASLVSHVWGFVFESLGHVNGAKSKKAPPSKGSSREAGEGL